MVLTGRFFIILGRHFDKKPIAKASLLFLFIKSLVIFTDHSNSLKAQAAKWYVLFLF